MRTHKCHFGCFGTEPKSYIVPVLDRCEIPYKLDKDMGIIVLIDKQSGENDGKENKI